MPHIVRRAMTLIELMVVIVILTVLVGGVLPVISPNNDARKIREAARGLQTYVMQAQARAARTGRPAGIAFRESSPGSGVALEVYQIEVPPPFAGFSQYSAGRLRQDLDSPNSPLWIQLVQTNTLDTDRPPINGEARIDLSEYEGFDQFPDGYIKKGDIVKVGGIEVRLVVPEGAEEDWLDSNDFYVWDKVLDNHQDALIPCELMNPLQTLPIHDRYREVFSGPEYGVTGVKRYQVFRQPREAAASAVEPYQLPAGVCIDLQASGTEGGAAPTQFATSQLTGTGPNRKPRLKQLAILLSPAGGVDSIHYSGTEFNSTTWNNTKNYSDPIRDASKIYLLLGRVENGGVSMEKRENFIVVGGQTGGGNLKERIAEMQRRINWMNLDSRWIAIDARNGRTVVGENAFVDPSLTKYHIGQKGQASVAEIIWEQAYDARQFARNMQRGAEK